MLLSTHATRYEAFLLSYTSQHNLSPFDQADVSPDMIRKRVADSSGSKYSVHKEAPRKPDLIAPVGTSYTPVGAPDISSMRAGAPRDVIGKTVSQRHSILICYT